MVYAQCLLELLYQFFFGAGVFLHSPICEHHRVTGANQVAAIQHQRRVPDWQAQGTFRLYLAYIGAQVLPHGVGQVGGIEAELHQVAFGYLHRHIIPAP